MAGQSGSAAGSTPAVEDPASKVFAFKVAPGRHVVPERDLPFGTLADVAKAHDVAWSQLLSPQSLLYINGAAVEALYRACCESAGVACPEPLTARTVVDAIAFVADDAPELFTDGLPPVGEPEQSGTT